MPIIIIILLIVFWPAISAFLVGCFQFIMMIIVMIGIAISPQSDVAMDKLICNQGYEHHVTKSGYEYCVKIQLENIK